MPRKKPYPGEGKKEAKRRIARNKKQDRKKGGKNVG